MLLQIKILNYLSEVNAYYEHFKISGTFNLERILVLDRLQIEKWKAY